MSLGIDDKQVPALTGLEEVAAAMIAQGMSQEQVAIELLGVGMALLTRATSVLEAAMVLEEFAQRRQASALGGSVPRNNGGPHGH